uniref:Uncharacterized protein n=1 Tax=Glossina palpalis gambiensis TaxID=67801 RepID=A0A1B0C7Q6_9MUSC
MLNHLQLGLILSTLLICGDISEAALNSGYVDHGDTKAKASPTYFLKLGSSYLLRVARRAALPLDSGLHQI